MAGVARETEIVTKTYYFAGSQLIALRAEGGGDDGQRPRHEDGLVNSPNLGQPGPFTADVPYAVTVQVHGRIVVFDSSPRDGGITHLGSREVTLRP